MILKPSPSMAKPPTWLRSKGWRRELFGERALKLIRGELALRFANKKVEAVEL
jgi:hypothetical protein